MAKELFTETLNVDLVLKCNEEAENIENHKNYISDERRLSIFEMGTEETLVSTRRGESKGSSK